MPTKTQAKKSTPKKPAAKTPAKKTTVKSAATRKPAAKTVSRTTTKKGKKSAAMQSFKVYPSREEFISLKPTRQTVYWIIILGIITVAQLFILKIQLEIIELTQPLVY